MVTGTVVVEADTRTESVSCSWKDRRAMSDPGTALPSRALEMLPLVEGFKSLIPTPNIPPV
jgi:hypothetical protein